MNAPDPEILKELVRMSMPFGKYKDQLICDLPLPYLVWFHGKGMPAGKLGMLLETMLIIKSEGLEHLLAPLKKT